MERLKRFKLFPLIPFIHFYMENEPPHSKMIVMYNIKNGTSHFLFISIVGLLTPEVSNEDLTSTTLQNEKGTPEIQLKACLLDWSPDVMQHYFFFYFLCCLSLT